MTIGTCNGTAGVFRDGLPAGPTLRCRFLQVLRRGSSTRLRYYAAQPTDAISPAASTAGAAATGAAEAADAAAPCMA